MYMINPTNQTIWPIDATEYRERKLNDTIKIIKLSDNQVLLQTRNFDPKTGKEIEPSTITVSIESIESILTSLREQKNRIEEQIDTYLNILYDIKNAKYLVSDNTDTENTDDAVIKDVDEKA